MRNIAFLFVFSVTLTMAQDPEGLLRNADSLFTARQFREAAQSYRELFASGLQSPAANLRAAYLAEAAGRRDETLLYLYRYYHLTRDEAARDKVTALADQYGLQGYEQSDADYFRSVLSDAAPLINGVLASLIVLALAALFHLRKRNIGRGRLAIGFTALTLSALLFLSVNFLEPPAKAVITDSHAIVFDGPSAAADRRSALSPGEMVEIIGQEDIWVKIRFRNKSAYIRKGTIERI